MTEALGLTPSQTAGPYLSIGLLRELTTTELVDPGDPRAIRIRGRLLDGAGDAVPDGLVEIWQANAAGRITGERRRSRGRSGRRSGTEDDGRFEFVTVKPGRVPWPGGGMQAPHIAVGILARGLLKRVVTRLYFPDEEEANAATPCSRGSSPSSGRRSSRPPRTTASGSTSACRGPRKRHSSRCDAVRTERDGMTRAVVLSAVRTPVGRYGGGLADVRPDDLAAIAVAAAVERAGVPPGEIEDVWLGCANQAGEDNRNVARFAALLAGLPESVAGVTVNRLCASGSPPSSAPATP